MFLVSIWCREVNILLKKKTGCKMTKEEFCIKALFCREKLRVFFLFVFFCCFFFFFFFYLFCFKDAFLCQNIRPKSVKYSKISLIKGLELNEFEYQI